LIYIYVHIYTHTYIGGHLVPGAVIAVNVPPVAILALLSICGTYK
jgi:hypothetical protein